MTKSLTFLVLLLSQLLNAYSQTGRTPIELTNPVVTVASYTNTEVIINGKTDLHITNAQYPLLNSIVKLNSDDAWIIFDNIRPNEVIDSFLQYVYVNDQLAVNNTNIRVAIYKQGTAVIPHGSAYQPLEVFTGSDYSGDLQKYGRNTYYNSLGAFDNKIRSFKLKKGYMVTFASASDGSGYSRVYIADNADLSIPVLPELLDGVISFIRVFNWEYVSKKGWCGYDFNQYSKLKTTWRYDWSAGGSTTPYVEYVPIRQNGGWPSWSEINGKQNVSHVLGFNEPDHTEQSNLTVAQALAQWPEMMKSGLRIGSPACTATSWIYQFIDSCDAHNLRVDFVAWHAYWGGKSPINWYNDLKAIHERTKRPIWITEWNNGANWTSEGWPDNTRPLALTTNNAAKQLADIKNILQVLDTAHFIERYSIYNWVEDARAMVLADTLTPAGKYYAADNSQMAFGRVNEVTPTWSFGRPSMIMLLSGNTKVTISSTDPNGDYNKGYILERKVDDGSFEVVQDTTLTSVKYSENIDATSYRKLRFRLRTKLPGGLLSDYSDESGFELTQGGDIQMGKVSYANVGWNSILFSQAFAAVPVIIFGSPTNNNYIVLMSNRVKQNGTTKFSFQFAPWAYQNLTSIAKEETIPYLILNPGSYNFGGLPAVAGKATVNATWTQVTFPAPFDTIPVVMATQLTSSSTFATGVRVKNITKTGFQAKIQKESKITTTPASETVSYVAIVPGTGVIDNKEIIVGKTSGAPVGIASYTNINYGKTIDNPIFIAQLQTCNDDTVTATLRCQSIYSTYARVFKQREKSTGITVAANEDAGYFIINPVNINTRTETLVYNQFKVFPNPANNILHVQNAHSNNGELYIYNMLGVHVKTALLENGTIEVSDLKPGYYFIKTNSNSVAKFLKL